MSLSNKTLTHSCLEVLTNVVWIFITFENNFVVTHKLEKYLKRSCWYVSGQHFAFKYFYENCLVIEIS